MSVFRKRIDLSSSDFRVLISSRFLLLPKIATPPLKCKHQMLPRTLSVFNFHKPQIKLVRSLYFTQYNSFTSTAPIDNGNTLKTHVDLSSIKFSGIANSVLSKCSHDKGKIYANASLKDLLLDISDLIPETTRKIRRFPVLKPEDVLEILLGFEIESKRVGIGVAKVESLWGIFKWVSEKNKAFKHLSKSCEVMASMLIRVGMLKEVEFLLLEMENGGIVMESGEVLGNLIDGYVGVGQLERAVSVYSRMGILGLVPSMSSYLGLLDILVRMKKTQLGMRVCFDMMEKGLEFSKFEMATFENVIKLLCRDGKIQEARNVVKKVMDLGLEPSSLVVNEIALAYCEKKDFEDVLSFFVEMKRAPDALVGNGIIHTLCCNFGVERADLFRQKLERMGFRPDEITFGILVGWSCREGNLKNAFIYFSEILSRGLKPDISSYNALISGVFREGMWKHARDIFDEMVDGGTMPNLSTFRILLAGYCGARQFDEAKLMIDEMGKHGLIELSSLEDPLSKAFMLLGLDSLAVRVKRDNDVGFSKTEFFDSLGNGLYLDTDLDEYEKRVTWVLDDSLMPNFNSLVREECDIGNVKNALMLVDELVRWGQELSLSVFAALVKGLCASRSHIKASGLLNKMPKLADQLDQETLNLLVQAYSKKGLTYKGKIILDGMLQRHLPIKNETYTALIMSLCKKGNLRDLLSCWYVARKDNWLPAWESCGALVGSLCQQQMLKEVLELFESMLVTYPQIRENICDVFLEKLCVTGFTSIAYILVEEILQNGFLIEHTAYRDLIRGFCRENKFSEAILLLDLLAGNFVQCADVSVLLIPHLCRAGRVEKAVSLKEMGLKMQSPFSPAVYSAMAKGFCKTGKLGEAANLIQDMLSSGLLPDAEIYNILVQGHCQANELRKVREVLGVVVRKNLSISISSYRDLVSSMCKNSRVLLALNLKEFMIAQSKSHGLVIFNILIFHLFRTGNSLFVNEVLGDLREKRLLLNEVTYNFLVYGFSQCKDVSSSVHYLSTMISNGFRPSNHSFRTVISCLCDVGDLGKALELSREIELRGWIHGSSIQNAIVEGLLSCGKIQEAENFVERMVEKCLIPDNINYDNLIKSFCRHGRLNKAVDLLNTMLKKGNTPISTSYDSVVQGLCTCNNLDRAMDFHTEMLDRDLKPSINTWGTLVHNLCREGRTAEAAGLLMSMAQVAETPTKEMYCSVINRYRIDNNLSKASEVLQAMQQSGYEPDFETHWSLISNLNNISDRDNNSSTTPGFLSRLLSISGFAGSKHSKAKLG